MSRQLQGFDYTAAMRRLCGDIVRRLPDLSHVALDRVALGVCQTRSPAMHGVYATLTPLRFAGGAEQRTDRGRRQRIERLVSTDGQDYLYLLNFYLPRFQNLPLEEKLITVVHELWHVSPSCDGDLRRHDGRCYAHGGSRQHYDAAMTKLAQRWLALDPPSAAYDFLQGDFAALAAEHGGVCGQRWRAPRLLPA